MGELVAVLEITGEPGPIYTGGHHAASGIPVGVVIAIHTARGDATGMNVH